MERKIQQVYLTYCKYLIAQDLSQVHCQILSIIFLRENIELNANSDMMMKNVKRGLNISIVTVFLNACILKRFNRIQMIVLY